MIVRDSYGSMYGCEIMKNEINSLVVRENILNEEIKNLIYDIRGKQVIVM